MKNFGKLLIILGLVLILVSVVVFVKYNTGWGGEAYSDSETPYLAISGLLIGIVGFRLLKNN